MEEWKNFDENYQVSSLGRVKSVRRDQILKTWLDGYGYPLVTIYGVSKKVHRLVAKTFLPIDDADTMTVNHKNFIKTDNRIENLEWLTSKANIEHARKANMLVHGESVHTARLTEENVIYIKQLFVEYQLNDTQIGELFGVNNSTISNIRRKIAWKHVLPELNYNRKSPTGRGVKKFEMFQDIVRI